MAKTTFQGPVKSINGFQGVGTGNSVSIGAGATSLTVDTHAGRMLYHNVAGAATLTLPAINSTADSGVAGPGNDPNSANNLGASFEIYIGTTKTGSFILQVANGVELHPRCAKQYKGLAEIALSLLFFQPDIQPDK